MPTPDSGRARPRWSGQAPTPFRLRPGTFLLGVVEGEGGDGGGDPFLVAVEFAELDLGTGLGVGDCHAGEGDVLAEEGGAGGAGDDADLRVAGVDAVAVSGGLVAFEFEADEDALRVGAAVGEGGLADEIVFVGGGDGEADAGLEGG